MYNLAHLYFYDENNRYFENESIVEESIKLLIKSSDKYFYYSKLLLCIISIMKFGDNPEDIINGLNKYDIISVQLSNSIHIILKLEKLADYFEERFNQLRDIDFIYDHNLYAFPSQNINTYIQNQKEEFIKISRNNINSDFYEGFGID